MTATPGPCRIALIAINGPGMPAWVGQELAAAGAHFIVHPCSNTDEMASIAVDAHVVWVFGGSTLLSEPAGLAPLKTCTVILRSGTGTDNVAVDEATRLGILVANTPLATAATLADHAVGLLLALVRRITAYDRAMRRGQADQDAALPNMHLSGSTVGLVGFGRTAQLVARRLAAFDARLIAADPGADVAAAQRLSVELVELDDLCRRADFISIHCPLLPSTHHLIDARRIALMKPKGVIVNTARGPVIEEAALVRALTDGRIGGTALDVFEIEPLDLQSPLRQMDNVVLTPHVAGYSDRIYPDFWRHSVDTLLEVVRGRPPKWIVNRPPNPRFGRR